MEGYNQLQSCCNLVKNSSNWEDILEGIQLFGMANTIQGVVTTGGWIYNNPGRVTKWEDEITQRILTQDFTVIVWLH